MRRGAYALGKAQRLISELRARGHHDPIHIHGALDRMCALYAQFGVDLGELRPATDQPAKELLPLYFGNYKKLVYLAQTEDAALDAGAAAATERLGDRKSTRLNSSH